MAARKRVGPRHREGVHVTVLALAPHARRRPRGVIARTRLRRRSRIRKRKHVPHERRCGDKVGHTLEPGLVLRRLMMRSCSDGHASYGAPPPARLRISCLETIYRSPGAEHPERVSTTRASRAAMSRR
jgi:hypothetical protein